MSNNLLDPWEGDQRDWPQVVEGFSASESHPYVENLRRRVQKRGARVVQNRRSFRVLTSKRELMPLLSRDADLTLLIGTFGQRRLRHAGFLNSASGCKDPGLVSLRRSIALALLNVAFGK